MNDCSQKGLIRRRKIFGQSLVEVALLFPILLIMLSGLFEFGFFINAYLAVQDSARNAARFASDSKYNQADDLDMDCSTTTFFYRQTACLVRDELKSEQPTILLCLPDSNAAYARYCPRSLALMDDIVVSVFGITRYPAVDIKRYPSDAGAAGWSFYSDLKCGSQGCGHPHNSRFSTADIDSMLYPGAANSGIVIVEVFYNYYQVLALPWFTAIIPDPIPVAAYSIWPQQSAEPTWTPE